MEEQKAEEKREKGNKKKKEAVDKRRGEEMREAAALKGMASKLITVNYCYLTKMNGHRQHFRRMLLFC